MYSGLWMLIEDSPKVWFVWQVEIESLTLFIIARNKKHDLLDIKSALFVGKGNTELFYILRLEIVFYCGD